MIKAIIFDFFGVIVGDGFESTYRTAGGDPEKDKVFIQDLLDRTNRGSISSEEFRENICEQLGITLEDYQNSVSKAEQVNYELLEFIKTLRPKYRTAILSNVNKGGLEKRVAIDTLNKYFDQIIVSGEVGFIKPEPEIYELTARRLGVELSECVFTDDRIGYVEGAVAVGMKGILYTNLEDFKVKLNSLLA